MAIGICSRAGSSVYSHLPRQVKLAFVALCSLTRSPVGGGRGEVFIRMCEPVFNAFEKGIWWLGLLCFVIVIVGISTVTGTFYVYIVPEFWQGNSLFFAFWFVLGNYLLVNVCFHYFKGFVTGPGSPKKIVNFSPYNDPTPSGWKVCFKCSQPKPPRAHHCRICNKCVLKMDHHCPWFFNCIGQNNHRYFMMFIAYMWSAVLFVFFSLWRRIACLHQRASPWFHKMMTSLGLSQEEFYPPRYMVPPTEHLFTNIVFFVCFGVSIALAVLGIWHLYLISRAETSIEFYTNKNTESELRSQGRSFVNKYSYGRMNNWRAFLGLKPGRSFLRHVLLPSGHAPLSDGMDWEVEKEVIRKTTGFSLSNHAVADMI